MTSSDIPVTLIFTEGHNWSLTPSEKSVRWELPAAALIRQSRGTSYSRPQRPRLFPLRPAAYARPTTAYILPSISTYSIPVVAQTQRNQTHFIRFRQGRATLI